jgi:hypothetical protein
MRSQWTRQIDVRVLKASGLLITVGLLLRVKIYHEWPRILECGLYVGCLLLLASYKPLRRVMAALPRRQQRFLLCLVGLILLSQIWSDPRKTFPFIHWGMYTASQTDPPLYFEYVGICEDGREVQIRLERVFRSQGRTVPWRLRGWWRGMHSAEGATKNEYLSRKYHALLTATVKRFNQQHPDTEVRRVRVVKCTLPRPAPGRELEVTRLSLEEFIIR